MKSIQLRSALGAVAMAAILTSTVFVYGAETDMKSSVNTNTTTGNTGMNTGVSGGLNTGVATQEKDAYDSTREGGNAAQASGTANATNNPANQPTTSLINRPATITSVDANTSAVANANIAVQNAANDLNQPLDARVENALVSNMQLDGTDVDVNEKNGEVTLKGKVKTEAQKQAAERAVRAINGVNSVKNKIKVDANFNATGAI